MSKKLIGASVLALLFSSICFAHGQNTTDTDTLIPNEMSAAVSFCDGHEGETVLPVEGN